jgi:hypothetical protein
MHIVLDWLGKALPGASLGMVLPAGMVAPGELQLGRLSEQMTEVSMGNPGPPDGCFVGADQIGAADDSWVPELDVAVSKSSDCTRRLLPGLASVV